MAQIKPAPFFAGNRAGKGFFYSVNVKVSGLRGFSRRSGGMIFWATH